MSPYQEYKLHSHKDFYVLEPTIQAPVGEKAEAKKEVIIFHRDAGSIEMADKLPRFLTPPEVTIVYGLIGLIRLLSGDHLMVITARESAGELCGHQIYKATEIKTYPFARNALYLTPEQAADEEQYRTLLQEFTDGATFYYSCTLDLTRNLQNQQHPLNASAPDDLVSQANSEFFWNKSHLQAFLDGNQENYMPGFKNFLIPIIYGYVKLVPVVINGTVLTYGLITRRGNSRVGTRFFSRGVDKEGNVSNFVETEQIISSSSGLASYTQTRGSIPLFWAQVTNTKYTPKLVIADRPETSDAFNKHFEKMIKSYGPVVAVNLINTKGYELPMGQKFAHYAQAFINSNNNLQYIHFDFHKECSKMRWHRIQQLIDQLAPSMDAHSYFHFDSNNSQVVSKQNGVIRSNCMDCLDRTNVVQSMVAKHILNQQLKAMNVVPSDHQPEQFNESFASTFRNIWADNADFVSVAYSGTGALKTDFTRTGKRTTLGPLQDGYNSVVRYFKNNYMDGSRQDGIDLFLGRYVVLQASPSPFEGAASWRVQLTFGLLFSGMAMLVLAMVGAFINGLVKLVSGLGLIAVGSSVRIITQNGQEFVDRPRLVPYEYDTTNPNNLATATHPPSEKAQLNENNSNSNVTLSVDPDRSKAE